MSQLSSDLSSYLINDDSSFASKAIHVGSSPTQNTNKEIVPPISLSTKYLVDQPLDPLGFMYIRMGSPTVAAVEKCLASLEGTKYCIMFPSGQAATACVFSLLLSGDHVVTQNVLYDGSVDLLNELNERNIVVDYVDAIEPKNVGDAVGPSTSLVLLESPTNPLMSLVDLKAINSLVKSKNPKAVTACDNTFMTPYFQRPAAFGIDIVIHSCTKYIGGHSDMLMGALCTSRKDLYDSLKKFQTTWGTVPSPFDCYLTSRSLKTLEVRMERHMQNGIQIAEFLERHPAVDTVFHPGLVSHPQHQLSLRQCFGSTGMLSFYLKGRDMKLAQLFISKLKMIYYCGSLGSVETTIILAKHWMAESVWKNQGMEDGLMRLSVGLESIEDLKDDLKRGLGAVIDKGASVLSRA